MNPSASTYNRINITLPNDGYFLNSLFSGKEKDSETGFSYFSARYYEPEMLSGWLSVDPVADKYPSLSPYAYCAWTRPTGGDEHRWIKYNIVNNPIKLVDPDGQDIADFYNLKGEWIGTDGNNDGRIFLVIDESDVSMILKNGNNLYLSNNKIKRKNK